MFGIKQMMNALDMEKIQKAIPVFILKKIKQKFFDTKFVIEKDLEQGQTAVLVLFGDAPTMKGMWVVMDVEGNIIKRVMKQDIEGLVRSDDSGSFLSMIPELLADSGQSLPMLTELTDESDDNQFLNLPQH